MSVQTNLWAVFWFYERSFVEYERSDDYMSGILILWAFVCRIWALRRLYERYSDFMSARLSNMSAQTNIWAVFQFYERSFVEYVRSDDYMSGILILWAFVCRIWALRRLYERYFNFMSARLSNMSAQTIIWARYSNFMSARLSNMCAQTIIWAVFQFYERSFVKYERSDDYMSDILILWAFACRIWALRRTYERYSNFMSARLSNMCAQTIIWAIF